MKTITMPDYFTEDEIKLLQDLINDPSVQITRNILEGEMKFLHICKEKDYWYGKGTLNDINQ